MEFEPKDPLSPRDALRELTWRLRESWGLPFVRRAPHIESKRIATPAEVAPPSASPAYRTRASLAPPVDGALLEGASERDQQLQSLAREIQGCRACRLCEKRKQAVPGEGSSVASVVFVGEAPGFDEDRSGRPFVGAAGRLLTAIIERGMGLKRPAVWIGNTVKCRPPGNRNPEPDEIQACEPFLRRQLDIVRPRVIVTLGRFASQLLTGRTEGIKEMRGRNYAVLPGWEVADTPVVPTFHPSFLLRSPEFKPQCWEDIQRAMKVVGLAPPSSPPPRSSSRESDV